MDVPFGSTIPTSWGRTQLRFTLPLGTWAIRSDMSGQAAIEARDWASPLAFGFALAFAEGIDLEIS